MRGVSGPILTPASVATVSSSQGLAIGRGNCRYPVGLRAHDSLSGNAVVSGTSTSTTYRQFWPLSDPGVGVVLPVFRNVNYSGSSGATAGDSDPNGQITIACAVECSDGTITPFTFNGGNHTFTIPQSGGYLAVADNPIAFGNQVAVACNNGLGTLNGVWLRVYVQTAASRTDTVTTTSGSPTVADATIAASDMGRLVTGTNIPAFCQVGAPLIPGVSFTLVQQTGAILQTSFNATGSGTQNAVLASQWPINYGGIIANSEVSNGNNGPDLTPTGSGTVTGGGNVAQFGPIALLGPMPSGKKPIIVQISDSIFDGTTDSSIGPVQRACSSLGYPLVKLSKSGEYAQVWQVPLGRRYRQTLIPGCTHAIIELGTNDGVTSGVTMAAIQTRLTAIATWLAGMGVAPWVCTVPPKASSSADGYATTAGQTPFAVAAQLQVLNPWIRSLPAPFAGFIEFGNLVSSGVDSGFWAVNARGRQVTDAATTSGSNVVTSATANFAAGDIGLGLFVAGGITGATAVVNDIISATQVHVTSGLGGSAANSGATLTNAVCGIGAWNATTDGVHPVTSLMTGVVYNAVRAAMAAFVAP